MKNSPSNRLDLLDICRFSAALSVLAFHYLYNGISNGKLSSISLNIPLAEIVQYGYFGVDFFFMISGYVIFFSASSRTALQFSKSRFTRLFPAYWTALCLTTLITSTIGHRSLTITPAQFLANLTMLAPIFGQPFIDGVYWTLVYELAFYGMIFTLLLLRQSRNLDFILTNWPYLMAICYFTPLSNFPFCGGHFAFFAAGSIFALGSRKPSLKLLPPLVITLLLGISTALDKAVEFDSKRPISYNEIIVTATIISFFLFFTFLNRESWKNFKIPGARYLGALTYPIYLIHAHIGYILLSKFANEKKQGRRIHTYDFLDHFSLNNNKHFHRKETKEYMDYHQQHLYRSNSKYDANTYRFHPDSHKIKKI